MQPKEGREWDQLGVRPGRDVLWRGWRVHYIIFQWPKREAVNTISKENIIL